MRWNRCCHCLPRGGCGLHKSTRTQQGSSHTTQRRPCGELTEIILPLSPLHKKSHLCVYNPFPCNYSFSFNAFIFFQSLLPQSLHPTPPATLPPFFLSLLLPANNDGQRPSLVLTGLDNLGFAISIVTRVSPLPAEPNN